MTWELVVSAFPQPDTHHAIPVGRPFLIGTGAGVDLQLVDPLLLERHAALMVDFEGLKAIDMGGESGTLLNGKRLPPRIPVALSPGDTIVVGRTTGRIAADGATVQKEVIPSAEFEVLKELGRGGMGRVVAARRLADGQQVAIKVLNESIVPGSPDHTRFLREGAIGQKLNTPYVVRVFEARVVDGKPFIVMEWVDGPSCEELVQRGQVPIAQVIRIGGQVARGLAVAAAAGIVHRDIKPSNILLSPDNYAKLTDFGIAKDLESTMDSLTAAGSGLGTLAYMAPEQVSEAKYSDASADLYALGGTLYHLLSGRPPFDIKDLRDLIMVEEQDPVAVSKLRPDVPPALAGLVHLLLSKSPWERPQSAQEVATRLEAIWKARSSTG